MERRKHTRAHSKIDLLFLFENKDDKIYSIKSKNIGRGGLYLIYDQEISPGTVLDIGVDLNMPYVGAETVKSEVKWCDKMGDNIYALGIEFKNLSVELRSALSNHVQNNSDSKPLDDEKLYLTGNKIWDLTS